jgi:ABC-type nickel/cobalt efflux system permease component RcnA
MMSPLTIIILIIAILACAAAAWMFFEKRRTQRLRTKFGPEYDRAVQQADRRHAESALEKRVKRVEKFHIRPLSLDERDRLSNAWKREQARFVDDPRLAVRNADRVVTEVMRARGYPMGEFEQRAADVSVDHPHVVENYRAAHEVAVQDSRGRASTEDLREAMVYYRALFLELLEEPALQSEEVRR